MNIASIRCISQVALLGAVTPNLRAVAITFNSNLIRLFFYYEHAPSELEEELTEDIATEIISDCTEHVIEIKKTVLAISEKIPEKQDQIFIYFRYEPS